jgi:hypothetical protein
MNGVDGHKEIILETKKIFMGRKESKDFGRENLSVTNECRRRTQRDHVWEEENLHKKKKKDKEIELEAQRDILES